MMTPRVPSERLLDSLRPNNCKFFTQSTYGECSLYRPGYDNYRIFKTAAEELVFGLNLPATVSQFVRERVCPGTKGEDRHRCENNACKKCSFVNYFIDDPNIKRKDAEKVGCVTTFTQEYGVHFL